MLLLLIVIVMLLFTALFVMVLFTLAFVPAVRTLGRRRARRGACASETGSPGRGSPTGSVKVERRLEPGHTPTDTDDSAKERQGQRVTS
jgi:hypothetical protein